MNDSNSAARICFVSFYYVTNCTGQHRSDDRGYHRDRDRRRSRDDYDRRRSGENDYYGGSGYNADRDCDGLQV